MKSFIPPLSDGVVRLRLAEETDLELLRRWRNREDVRNRFLSTDLVSPEQHLSWWHHYREIDGDWLFVIEALDPDLGPRPLGAISLYHYVASSRSAEYGRLMIGEDWARGKGYARAASRLLIDYGFAELGLEMIYLEVLLENKPARRLYESLGFRPAGEASRPDAFRLVLSATDAPSNMRRSEGSGGKRAE